jgi:hypothetical protein
VAYPLRWEKTASSAALRVPALRLGGGLGVWGFGEWRKVVATAEINKFAHAGHGRPMAISNKRTPFS